MSRDRGAFLLLFALLSLAFDAPEAMAKRRAVSPRPTVLQAVDDSYLVSQGNAVSIDAANGVLANDLEPHGKPLIALLFANPVHGTVTLNPDGSFTYTHDGSNSPTDTFRYKTSNGSAQTAPATVTMYITPDRLPLAAADQYSLGHAATLNIGAPGVLSNDADPTGKTLTAVVATGPAHGTLTLNANGSFAYTHDGSNTTVDSFSYRASSGTLDSNPATVTLTIGPNVPPTVVSRGYTAAQNTPLSVAAPGVLTGASDPDSMSMTAVAGTAPGRGTLVLNPDGSFTYTPAAGYAGPDSFTFFGNDGIANSANAGTISITVLAAADANGDAYTAAQGSVRTVGAPGVLANDAKGSTIASYGASAGTEQKSIGAQTPTAKAGVISLNSDGSFVYQPPPLFTGSDSFRYVVGNAGGSSSALVTISVSAPPLAVGDAYPIAMSAQRRVNAPGVLANDTTNGGVVTANTTPLYGALTVNSDGSFAYTPTAGYTGPDSFAYTVTNSAGSSSATVALTVVAPPLASNDAYLQTSGTPLTIPAAGFLANDTLNSATIASFGATTGSEQTTLGSATATSAGGSVVVNANGSFTWTPAASFSGSDTFRYVVTNFAGSATGTVTISAVAAPVAANDAYDIARNTTRSVAATGVLGNDTANGAAIVSFGANGTEQTGIGQASATVKGGLVILRADGSFTYTPPNAVTGTDTFNYILSNFNGTAIATVTFTIYAPPVAVNDTATASMNATITIPAAGVLANDNVNAASVASYGPTGVEQTAIGANAQTMAQGTVSLNADGSYSYTPKLNYTGSDSFNYAISNYAGSSLATVSLTVQSPPVAAADAYTAVTNVAKTFAAAAGVLANDTANGGTLVSFGAVTGTEQSALGAPAATFGGGSVTLSADGSFTYTSAAGFSGSDTFVYLLRNSVGSSTATVTISVATAPVALADAYDAAQNAARIVAAASGVLANDLPYGATVVSYGKATGVEQTAVGQSTPTAAGGSIVINTLGGFTYTAPNATGSDSFQYVVQNAAGTATATVTMTIYTAPTVANDTYTTPVNTPKVVAAPGVLTNDFANLGTLTANTNPAHGTVAVGADGSFTYTPHPGYVGSDSFTYTVSNFAGSPSATVSLTVVGVPVARNDDVQATAVNAQRTVLAADGVLANDTHAQASITGFGKITGAEQPSIGSLTPTELGGDVRLNADGSFTYLAPATSGTDRFRYTLTSIAGTSTATVTIPVVRAPVAVADSYDIYTSSVHDEAHPGVLANDTPDGGAIVSFGAVSGTEHPVNAIGTTAEGGTVRLRGDGSFSYTPPAVHKRTDRFHYVLENLAGRVTQSVTLNRRRAFLFRQEADRLVFTSSHDLVNWTPYVEIRNGLSPNAGPHATVFDDKIFVFYALPSFAITYSYSHDGVQWFNGPTIVPGPRSLTAKPVVFEGRIRLFYTATFGPAAGLEMVESNTTGFAWSGIQTVPTVAPDTAWPSPAVFLNQLHLLYQNSGNAVGLSVRDAHGAWIYRGTVPTVVSEHLPVETAVWRDALHLFDIDDDHHHLRVSKTVDGIGWTTMTTLATGTHKPVGTPATLLWNDILHVFYDDFQPGNRTHHLNLHTGTTTNLNRSWVSQAGFPSATVH